MLATLVAMACELEETTVPATASLVVVHGLLNASASTQLLLLERTWNGEHQVATGQPYNPNDPVESGSGYPEINATIDVTTPDGDTVRAQELRLVGAEPGPAGVYRLPIPGATLAAGGRYGLLIRTSSGEILRSAATVPPTVGPPGSGVIAFNRARDTLLLEWPSAGSVRGYQVRIETPFGPWMALTEQAALRVLGTLRNVFVEGLPRVLVPGFRQIMTISALDSNYYDYARSTNNQYSGRGLISRVEGGLGVFGAIVRTAQYELRVSAPFALPFEGDYAYHGTPEDSARTLVVGMTLFVESRAARRDQPDALSGAFRARPGSGIQPRDTLGGLLGIRFGDSVRVAFLSGQAIRDTIDVFRAEVRGDTLVGRYRQRAGTWRFIRRVRDAASTRH